MITHPLGRISKLVFSRRGKVQTPSDAFVEISGLDLSKATIVVVCAITPPWVVRNSTVIIIVKEIRPRVCVIMRVIHASCCPYCEYSQYFGFCTFILPEFLVFRGSILRVLPVLAVFARIPPVLAIFWGHV